MEKGYGVYYGCIYEGGSIVSPIYIDKVKAISYCHKLVRKYQKRRIDRFNKSEKNEYEIRRFENYKWKKRKGVENYWHDTVDCIFIQEFDIIP